MVRSNGSQQLNWHLGSPDRVEQSNRGRSELNIVFLFDSCDIYLFGREVIKLG
jgi:hypothetical protein